MKGKAKKRTQTVSCSSGQADEYETFTAALKKIVTVSHKEMQERLKRAASDRASNAKD